MRQGDSEPQGHITGWPISVPEREHTSSGQQDHRELDMFTVASERERFIWTSQKATGKVIWWHHLLLKENAFIQADRQTNQWTWLQWLLWAKKEQYSIKCTKSTKTPLLSCVTEAPCWKYLKSTTITKKWHKISIKITNYFNLSQWLSVNKHKNLFK